jgi:hypothetical protein
VSPWLIALRRSSDFVTVFVALGAFHAEQTPILLEPGL